MFDKFWLVLGSYLTLTLRLYTETSHWLAERGSAGSHATLPNLASSAHLRSCNLNFPEIFGILSFLVTNHNNIDSTSTLWSLVLLASSHKYL
jgi:hypothetical protein